MFIGKHGWLPDTPDHRDYLYRTVSPNAPLPPSVDLRPKFGPCYDQGQLGSCTGNALAGHIEFLHGFDPSRLFIYYNERDIEGTVASDSGAMIRDGIKALAQWGAPPETDWPYDISKFTQKPPAQAYDDGKKDLISVYRRLTSLSDMQQCLAEGFPFVFGFTVYESFESAAVAKSGKVNLPKRGERALGGHAVLCVGYDLKAKRFIVRNSWGPDWGLNGYFTMPFGYLTNRNLSDDFWTIRK